MSRTRRLMGLLAAALLAVLVVPLAAFGEATTDPGEPKTFTRVLGTLEIETGQSADGLDYVRVLRLDADRNELGRTTETPRRCLVGRGDVVLTPETSDGDPLEPLTISIAGADGTALDVGLVSNGLGSRDKNNCGTSNGYLEGGEVNASDENVGAQTMTVALGGGLQAVRAELDIEGKFGASLDWATLDGSGTPNGTGRDQLVTDNSDNGSDAGPADNKRVTVRPDPVVGAETAPTFTAIQLAARSDDGRGVFSLEGGGDFPDPASNRTVFVLSETVEYAYTMNCGQEIFVNFAADSGDSTQKAQSARLKRYDTKDKQGDDCSLIGVNLTDTSDGTEITLDNTDTDAFGVGQLPYLRLTLIWRVALLDGDGNERPMEDVYAELEREIDLFDGAGLSLVQHCLTDNDDANGMKPATQPTGTNWCLLSDTTVVENGFLIQTQIYDGEGDPRWL